MMREIIPYQRRGIVSQPWPIGLGTLHVFGKFCFGESRQLPIVKGPKNNLIDLFSPAPKQHPLGGGGGRGANFHVLKCPERFGQDCRTAP